MAVNDVANIAGTYGHFLSTINGRAKDPIKLETSTLYTSSDADKHQVLQGYAEAQAQHISCDLCYIDPPYMKRQYAANYHILETIARGDEPEAIGVSGLRPWRDQYSNFCTKTKIRDSFREIFSNMDCKNYLISYSEDGLLSVDDFRELLVPFGDIEIEEF
jgi:adenine-specific DNA-methyltransferase